MKSTTISDIDRHPRKWCAAGSMLAVLLLLPLIALVPEVATAQESDDFNACELDLNRWNFIDPMGDATAEIIGVGGGNPQLAIHVPAGSNHEPWTTNTAPRVLQTIPDGDLSVEARFDSTMTAQYQLEGIIVQQADDVFLRFEFHYANGQYYAYAASVNGASARTKAWRALPGAPKYMRVTRVEDDWTFEWAGTDAAWTTAASFSHSLQVTAMGPYAGNYSTTSAPEFTAFVDYFFAVQAPILPEDGANLPQDRVLTLDVGAGGSVALSPDQTAYSCDQVVTLTALPDAANSFAGWTGDLSGTANPEILPMASDRSVGATFTAGAPPPQIKSVAITPAYDSITVSWSTDFPGDSRLDWGLTPGYEGGFVEDPTSTTNHVVTVTGLMPETLHNLRVSSNLDDGRYAEATGLQAITRVDPGSLPTDFVSDDFNDCGLDPDLWTVIDPLADGTVELLGGGTGNAQLHMEVPAGTAHDPWTTNESLRALQSVDDGDLSIVLKFDTLPTQGYQMQGLTVQETPEHYLRLEFYHNGAQQRALTAVIEGGGATVLSDVAMPANAHLRVTRVGDDFALSHSADGIAWTTASSFTHAMTVTAAGPHIGNFPLASSIPQQSVLIDYVFDTLAPVVPEDGATLTADEILIVNTVGNGSVTITPDQPSYLCTDVVMLEAETDPDHVFTGWTGDLVGLANPQLLSMTASRMVVANFEDFVPSPVISNLQISKDSVARQASISWSTNLPASTNVDYGQTTDYELGSVGDPTLSQAHQVILSDLERGVEYHFKARSVTAEGGSSETSDVVFTLPLLPGEDPSGVLSDDFNTCALDTARWTVRDPLGDGTYAIQGAGSGDSKLLLSVPAGLSHEPWATDTSLQVTQRTNDTDFTIETKFDSPVTLKYQQQGMIVKETDSRFLRFELYSDGAETFGLIGFTDAGSPTVYGNIPVPATSTYLRVERTGDEWTLLTSEDGSSWIARGSATQPLVATQAGIYAGNHSINNNAPPHTAIIDYFRNTSLAFPSEDIGAPPSNVTLSTVTSGSGAISVSPGGPTYSCGQELVAWATAQPNHEFAGWTGDLESSDDVLSFAIVRDTFLVGNFQLDVTPPIIESIDVVTGPNGAEIRVRSNEVTTYAVSYGETNAYELGTVTGTTPSTDHSIVLNDLSPQTDYHFEVTLLDSALLQAASGDLILTTALASGAGPAGIYSDDFNSCAVDTGIWTIVDPLGDASFNIVGAGSGDAKIEIFVPGGQTHEPWGVNTAPRLMQPISNTDFEVQVRFDSPLTARYQEQGIVVEDDALNFLRFDFYSDGAKNWAFAAVTESGTPSSRGQMAVAPATPIYMRVARVGDVWTQSFSYDGVAWTVANQFSHVINAAEVGVFAGNASGASSPSHTAVLDYFWTTDSPTVPEDFGAVGGAKVLDLSIVGAGNVVLDPDQAEYGCGETVGLAAVPDLGFAFDGWSGDLTGTNSQTAISMTSDRTITATFSVDVAPPVISNVEITRGPSTTLVTWNTNEPTISRIDYGLTTSYEMGFIESLTYAQQHSLVLPGLDPTLAYHIEITATDGAPFETSTGDILVGPAEGPLLDIFYGTSQIFGAAGLAQPMINILGNAEDPDGLVLVTWSLNGGPEAPLSIGRDVYRLDRPGDFNVEIPSAQLLPGINFVEIRAVDGLGNESIELIMLTWDDATVPPIPYSIDWTSVSDIQSVAQIVDGEFGLQPNGLRVLEMGYDRIVAVGDLSWTDYEATARVTVNEVERYFAVPSTGPALGLIVRWPGHTPDGNQPARQWWPLGGFAAYRWFDDGVGGFNEFKALYGDTGVTHGLSPQGAPFELGTAYVFKLRVETQGNGDSLYSFKLWRESDPEPAAWDLTGLELSVDDVPSGSLLLVAHHVDVTWHDVVIEPVP